MMRLPLNKPDAEKNINIEELKDMADTYIKNNYNYFDTGYHYHQGESEVALRKAIIERYSRNKLKISDKLPIYAINKEEQLNEIFNDQLNKTGAEYFDYYLLHDVGMASEVENKNVDTFSYVKSLREIGVIRHLGFSSHADATYIESVLKKHPDLEFILLQLNYLDWENNSIQSRKCYEIACKYDIPVMVMEPLKGGFLSNVPSEAQKLMFECNNQTPTEWAFRFLAGFDNIKRILSGMNNTIQVKNNLKIFKNLKPLDEDELKIIDEVRNIINRNIAINCTQCHYCQGVCPVNINIPKMFDLYNHDRIENAKGFTVLGNIFVNYSKDKDNGLPSDCINCKRCIPKCPQHLNIPEEIKKVETRFQTPTYGFKKIV